VTREFPSRSSVGPFGKNDIDKASAASRRLADRP
jgi:hypothetical protein